MRFNINIRPYTIIKGRGTLRNAQERMSGIHVYSTRFGSAYTDNIRETKYVYGYNVQVFKRRKHRIDKHWVMYVYKFPIEIFSMLNAEIHQKGRNFKITRKK